MNDDNKSKEQLIQELKIARQQASLSRQYLDIASVIMVIIDRNQIVQLINKKGCEILGYPKEEIIGKNWFDNFIPQTQRTEVEKVFRQLISGEIEPVEYYENTILDKEGDEHIIAWHNSYLTDEDGNIVSTLSSGQDITRRRQAEESLTVNKRLLERTLYSLHDAVFMIDALLVNIVDSNPGATKIFGYSHDEFKNMPISTLFVSNDEFLRCREVLDSGEEKELSSSMQFRLKRKDGSTFLAKHYAVSLDDEQGIHVCWVCIISHLRNDHD